MKRFIGKIIAAAVSTALIFSLTAGVAVEARTPALYEFEPWAGNGTTSVQVGRIDNSRFMKIIRWGEKQEEVPKEAYSITGTNGDTIITLNESYLKSLNKETDQGFWACFSGDGIITNRFAIVLEETQTEITVPKEEDEKVIKILEEDENNEVDSSHYTITDNGNKMTIVFEKEYMQTVSKKAFEIQLSGNMMVQLRLYFGMKGDADGDSAVTVNDAKIALKAALNLMELSNKQFNLLNLDGDSRVTLKDARKILRVALNIERI